MVRDFYFLVNIFSVLQGLYYQQGSNFIPALPFCHIKLTAQKHSYLPKIEELITLGDHLKKRRFEFRLQQKDVAKLLGVDTQTVYNWEKNRSSPSLYQIPKVIEFLGYDPYTTKETLGGRIKRATAGLGDDSKGTGPEVGG